MERIYRKDPFRLGTEGPLAPYFQLYCEFLAAQKYSEVSFCKKTFIVSEYSRWLGTQDIAASEITSDHEAAFLRARSQYRVIKPCDPYSLRGISNWLTDRGVIQSPEVSKSETSKREAILREYAAWLREERGLAPCSVKGLTGYVDRFLRTICDSDDPQLSAITVAQVIEYIQVNAPRGQSFSTAKNIVTSLRSFFRFALSRGHVQTDLAAAVPSVPGWSQASIPRAMSAEGVRTLLGASRTWRTPAGRRDHAILMLLARLGLRAGELVNLELDDIDWEQGWLRVRGKGRSERPMPLPHDVGEALVAYLKEGRPVSRNRRVFLHSRVPYQGFTTASGICQLVRRAINRAGVDVRGTGSHQLRHALAVDMLQQGLSLGEIGQLLRHRTPEATRRYAKVDLAGLRAVALPWPGQLT